VRGTLLAFDSATGASFWRRELVGELGGTRDVQGYVASPLAWRDLVIVPVGGPGRALLALRQDDGEEVWRSGDFENALTSPFLIHHGGAEQVVCLLDGAVAGFAPASGRELWRHAHPSPRGDRNISTPVWDGADRLFVSSLDGGSRMLRLASDGGSTVVTESWRSSEVRVQFTNVLWRGDTLYAANGGSGPMPLVAIGATGGDVLWRDRRFSRAHLLLVGERALLLDQNGTLAVVELSPSRARTLAAFQVVTAEQTWTPPAVAGGRVYIRTRARVVALELPAP
jgi:outer membrane protein assembly factor BamB